jgi:alpha-ketoglutarate-dependent taurine dioxygenase
MNMNALNTLPKKLTWSNAVQRHPRNAFFVQIPDAVKLELHIAAREFYDQGISVDDIDLEGDLPSQSFPSLRAFASSVRNTLLHETGLVLLKGLDLDAFWYSDSESMVACSKMAYYLICNHIGTVDGSARGRLFDVTDQSIDAMGKTDNVLFSVSNCKADWHTDGASKDKVYDAVALLCIHPSCEDGKSKVSNACNAHDSLSLSIPQFMMNELHRPVCRDILENGKGNRRRLSMRSKLSRADSVMSLRISYNSYPIFDVQQGRMRFRYMRHWIESAHKKMHWKVPTLLRIAMDALDDTLDRGCCFHESLERGDILICNNACVAHGRDSFKNTPGKPPRHLVRAWMQVQHVDLLTPSNS